MMPFRYTSSMSLEDAEAQARAQGVQYDVFSIEPMYEAFMATLAVPFEGTEPDTTEENLQARLRGVLLMALSNKFGSLVLTTGNKSEMAVGYSTLYGDMAGGFDALKDVPKTLVFRLSRYRNTLSAVIPERVISRPPSAELAPDQKDEDSLPGYDILDQILNLYVERDFSADSIVAEGFDKAGGSARTGVILLPMAGKSATDSKKPRSGTRLFAVRADLATIPRRRSGRRSPRWSASDCRGQAGVAGTPGRR